MKTQEQVCVWLEQWVAKKNSKKGFNDLKACIEHLSEQDGEELLEHVTKVHKNKEEFNTTWTKDPTHVLGSSLYVGLREWLGAGAVPTATDHEQDLAAQLAALRLDNENARQALEEARRREEEAARQQAEEEARRREQEAARRQAEEAARRREEEAARQQAEEEARRREQEAARRQAEEAARLERQFVNGQGLSLIFCGHGSVSKAAGASKQTEQAGKGLPNISRLTLKDLAFGVFDVNVAVPSGADAPASNWRPRSIDARYWTSEASIRDFVKAVLLDAIAAGGLPLRLYDEIKLVALRPDVWVVAHSGHPLGVVEVKIPSEAKPPLVWDEAQATGAGHDTVYHQITYYMMLLQNYFGLPVVFGIVSTYNQWRICWLGGDAAKHIAEATTPLVAAQHIPTVPTVPAVPAQPALPAAAAAAAPADENRRVTRAAAAAAATTATATATATTMTAATAATAAAAATDPTATAAAAVAAAYLRGQFTECKFEVPVLWGELQQPASSPASPPPPMATDMCIGVSKVYAFSDQELPLVLVTLMHKMFSLLVSAAPPKHIRPEDRRYVCYSDAAIEWLRLDEHPASLQTGVMCNSAKNAKLYALSCVGQGADGQAWLVRDYRGLLYVCKLPKVQAESTIGKEFDNWAQVHPELIEAGLVQQRQFGPGKVPALIMPRFAHVQESQHKDPDIRAAVKEEIQRWAQCKMVHADLKWRHVGLYKDQSDKLIAVFFDLARVEDEVPMEEATQRMLVALFAECDCDGCATTL